MSLKERAKAAVAKVWPFLAAEVETIANTEIDAYVAPSAAGPLKAAVDKEIEAVASAAEAEVAPTVTPEVPKS
jgi:hypothetical protein